MNLSFGTYRFSVFCYLLSQTFYFQVQQRNDYRICNGSFSLNVVCLLNESDLPYMQVSLPYMRWFNVVCLLNESDLPYMWVSLSYIQWFNVVCLLNESDLPYMYVSLTYMQWFKVVCLLNESDLPYMWVRWILIHTLK